MFENINRPIFMMSPPFKFSADIPNNIWMSKLTDKERQINIPKAIDQWHKIYYALAQNSIIYLLPTTGLDNKEKSLQDQVFVSNLAIVLPKNPNRVIVANFRSPPRRGETKPGVEFFENMGFDEVLVADKYFEGEADLKYFGNDKVYLGAFGLRTSLNALKWFQDTQGIKVIPIKNKSGKFYHLDCSIFPISKNKIVVIEHLVEPNTLRKIEKYAEVIPITDKGAAETGITNCVRAGRNVICGTALDDMSSKEEQYKNETRKGEILGKICSKLGLELILINHSEFRKGGGDISCLCCRLNPGTEFKNENN